MNAASKPAELLQRPYYSHVVPRAGSPLFLTGQVAWDEKGDIVGVDDVAAQIEQVWRNIRAVLDAAGADVSDIVKLTTYATSRAFIPAIHAERAKHFAPRAFPASTFVQVAGLAEKDLMVEVEAILILPVDHPVFDEAGTPC